MRARVRVRARRATLRRGVRARVRVSVRARVRVSARARRRVGVAAESPHLARGSNDQNATAGLHPGQVRSADGERGRGGILAGHLGRDTLGHLVRV